jgi:hypothetical protein
VIGICLAHSSLGWAGPSAAPDQTRAVPLVRSYAVPLSFEVNQGQVDGQVKFLARGPNYTVFLTPGAAVLGLRHGDSTKYLRLLMQGAATASPAAGEDELPGRSNYFVGRDPGKWRTNIPTYARVRFGQVYPRVDLVYYGRQGRLENDFEIGAGADPRVITWEVQGAEHIRVASNGDLVLTVAGSPVRLEQPRAYQFAAAQKQEVQVRYRAQGKTVSFELGNYDRSRKLIIDPVLTYSSYLGGSGGDAAYGIAVDSAGEAYVTGVTASTNFPVSANGYQTTLAGTSNVFITKFNAGGTGILYSAYLGGSGVDIPSQIVLDATNDIFVVGSTNSNNFPTTSGALEQDYSGNQDAFLTELNPGGSALVYSTYIGGTRADFGTAVTLDAAGNAYVTGSTQSTDFPTMNPLQISDAGLYDAFVTEVSPTGALVYSTYLGGSYSDYGTSIAVDSTGNVYVSGYTYSLDFPTQNALQPSLAGGSDIFLTKFKPGSSALLYSTYLGGASNDVANAMVVDSGGYVYLTGSTQSGNFPVTVNAYQSSLLGTSNVFLTKVAAGGASLIFSTLFGGSATDQANAMVADAAGNLYLTGFTQSTNFPQLDSFQAILGIAGAGTCGSTNDVNLPSSTVCADAFVAKFASDGLPVYSSFLGGSNTDTGQAIAVDASGAAYVAGKTFSTNFSTTAGTFQWLFEGSSVNSNAFISKVSPQDAPAVALNPQQISFGNEPLETASTAVTVTLGNPGSAALGITSISGSGNFTQTNNCGTSLPAGSATCSLQVTFTPTSVGLQTAQLTIVDSVGTQDITVSGNGVTTGGSLILSPTKMTFAAQTVGTTSPSQTAILANNGNQAVTITNITASGGFEQTNNCGPNFPTVPVSLNAGQSCTISVSFTPTSTGNVTGSVSVASNAVNTSTSLSLSGTGSPVFTLSSNQRSSIVTIGSSVATFAISVAGPSTFQGTIALSCSATCTFSPSAVPVGGSSTLSVTGLSPSSANPTNFTVTGSSGSQSATISLSVFFADYSLAATPSGTTVTAGNEATYTVTVTPTNGFNQVVLLSCPGVAPLIPVGAICYFNPPVVTLSGTSATASSVLTITTTTESRVPRRPPPPTVPPGWTRWILVAALLALATAMLVGFSRSTLWMRPRLRLMAFLFAIALVALGVGCENYVNPININPAVNGTPSGTYGIVLTGTLGNGSGVERITTVNLSVLP